MTSAGSLCRPALGLAFCISAALLSGCLSSGDPQPSSAGPARASLEDFAVCDFSYPDGSPVPCEGTAAVLELQEHVPPGWVCWSADFLDNWGFYRNLAEPEGQYGFAFVLSEEAEPVAGVIKVETEGETRLYSWPLGASRGFVAFPPAPWGESVTYEAYVYHAYHETNYSDLADGDLEQSWSLYDDGESSTRDFYLLQRIVTGDEEYWFHVGGDQSGYTRFFEGRDFQLQLKVSPLISFPEQTLFMGHAWPTCPIP